MNDTNHPARRLRHGDRPTEPLTFEDAAANKAAEEGGLPELPQEIEVGGEGWDFEDFKSQKTFSVDHMHEYALKAIAADRASRQVANKAEVEGIASSEIPEGWPTEIWLNAGDEDLAPFSEYDELSWCSLPLGENDIRYVREDLLATPPATTGASTARDQALEDAAAVCDKKYEARVASGHPREASAARNCAAEIRSLKGSVGASTVLTDERKRAMFEKWATKQGGYDLSPYNWRVKSVGGVPYTGYVRPYKQDRTVHAFEGFVAALGEVATQAGQVAATVLSEELTDRIARNYFSEQWAVQHAKDAIHDALTEASAVGEAAVPEGFVLVPVKPTPKMVDATFNHVHLSSESHNARNKRIYAAMIAAAPSPAKESK